MARYRRAFTVGRGASTKAAISQTEKENLLAGLTKANDVVYTLIIGPEDETPDDRGVCRRTRIAAVRGVYRASSGRLAPQKAENVVKASFGKKRCAASQVARLSSSSDIPFACATTSEICFT